MKLKPKPALNRVETCVLSEMVERRGVVMRSDIPAIAEICKVPPSTVYELVNATSPRGIYINSLVDQAVGDVPLTSKHRQLGYIQLMLDEKLQARREAELPMTGKDPADLIDLARKIIQDPVQPGLQVNINQQTQVFDLSGYNDTEVRELLDRVKAALSGEGKIIDTKHQELATARSYATALPRLASRVAKPSEVEIA